MFRKILSLTIALTLLTGVALANKISFSYNEEMKLTGEITYPDKIIIPKYVRQQTKKTGKTPKILHPIIVYIPENNTSYENEPMASLLEHGYAVAVINHSSQFPQNVSEVKAAIRFIKMNADKYGVDVGKMGVWGGNTAAFVATTPYHAEFEDYKIVKEGESSKVLAALLVAPCVKNPPTIFHDVTKYVDSSASYSFIVNSAMDRESPIKDAELLANKLKLALGYNNVTFVKSDTASGEKFVFDKNMVKKVIDFFDNKFKMK